MIRAFGNNDRLIGQRIELAGALRYNGNPAALVRALNGLAPAQGYRPGRCATIWTEIPQLRGK
jgi:hypothetical protein